MPLPEDLTGDGDLFMLRVRGDSMIEAGIFDRDYVVVRQQPTAEDGDIVVAGHPRRGGDGQDVPAPRAARSCCGPENATHRGDGVRPERDHDLRQGRHRCSAACSDALSRRRGTGRASRSTWSSDSRVTSSPAVCAISGITGPEVERRDAVRREAGDVGPAQLRAAPARSRPVTNSATSGSVGSGGAGLRPGSPRSRRRRRAAPATWACASSGVYDGREAAVHHDRALVGHDVVLSRCRPRSRTTWIDSR